jgi:hypothetical protein
MEQVKLLRLKSGEDVISYVEPFNPGEIILRSPMAVLVKMDMKTERQTILMDHWLPVTVIMHNEAVIPESEVLTSLDPTAEFSQYYENAILAIDMAKEGKGSNVSSSNEDELTDLELKDIMNNYGLDGSKTIH